MKEKEGFKTSASQFFCNILLFKTSKKWAFVGIFLNLGSDRKKTIENFRCERF